MTTRSEKLNRLVIGSRCSTSWEGMQGEDRRRHCGECNRHVHDFAQRTPREIAALIEASRGHLCARITRDGLGRLVTRTPEAPATAPADLSWRASPVAAALVTAFLGIGSAAAAPPALAPPTAAGLPDPGAKPDSPQPQRAAEANAGLQGLILLEDGTPIPGAQVTVRDRRDGRERAAVTDPDGRFTIRGLPAAVYEVRAEIQGLDFAPLSGLSLQPGEQREVKLQGRPAATENVGVLVVGEQSLREVFADSELVVTAIAGASVAIDQDQDYGDVATELVVTSTLKGKVPSRKIVVHHGEQGEPAEGPGKLAPGTQVLAFLKPSAEETGKAVYESADYSFGLKALSPSEVEAYGERLATLAPLLRHGEPSPENLAEWLVATAEEPLTRREAIFELSAALNSLADLAKRRETSIEQAAQELRKIARHSLDGGGSAIQEPVPEAVAAFLTGDQRERLTRALLATSRLSEADIDLYEIVQPWAKEAATTWLAREFQRAEPAADGLDWRIMGILATALDDEELKGLLATAEAEINGYNAAYRPDESAAEFELLDAQVAAAEKELRRRFVQALDGR